MLAGWVGVLAVLDDGRGLCAEGAAMPPHAALPLPLLAEDDPLQTVGSVHAVWLAGGRVHGSGMVDPDRCRSLVAGVPVAPVVAEEPCGWRVERVILTSAPPWPEARIVPA